MKAVVVREHGGLDKLLLEDVPVPRPGPRDALIRVRAVALNNLDIWARSGPPEGRSIYPWRERRLPITTGVDVAGVVEEVGRDAGEVAVGDPVVINSILFCGGCEWCLAGEQSMCREYRIFGEHTPGGMAEFTVAPAMNLLQIPAGVSFERAAAAPVCCTTAWRMLITIGRLRVGEDVLVVGASGGVGSAALQIGKRAGARVFALVGGSAKAGKAEALGATPIDRERYPQFGERVRELTGSGVHVVADPVGAATWPESIRSLRPGGRMVVCGASGGERPNFDIRELYQRHRQILGAPMGNVSDFETVMHLVFRGEIEPVIHAVLPLSAVREAHRCFEAREHFGKIVLVP